LSVRMARAAVRLVVAICAAVEEAGLDPGLD
jgi:hypothetical protein